MKAIVVGAGPGGLTAALFLHRIGWEVEIYESVRELKPLGVGINLLPHGTRELMVLGLAAELEQTGIQTRALEYRTRYGHLIHSDPRGRAAGCHFPAYSIHRGHLQFLLRDAVLKRIGECINLECHFERYTQDEAGVTAFFIEKNSGARVAETRGDVLIGADGIRSGVRKALYPDEGPMYFDGIWMWRGAREQQPFLDGRTMVIAGNHDLKIVLYPISAEADRRDRSLVNWVAELRIDSPRPVDVGDWNRTSSSDVLEHVKEFELEFVDVPQLIADTETVYEYPLVDRDPLDRWTFGRVTLLGDAAHPMFPIGANGTSQAILDARALSDALAENEGDPQTALEKYQEIRLKLANRVVISNREYHSERYLDVVDRRMKSPDDRIDELISQQEIDEITYSYRKVAGFDVSALNNRGLS